MNQYSSFAAIVFLIGIYLMATIVVCLTVINFFRPKPKNKAIENKIDPLAKTKDSALESQAVPGEKSINHENPGINEIPDILSIQPAPTILTPSVQKIQNFETKKTAELKGVKSITDPLQVVPSIQIVNDKLGKSLKEEKPASDPLQIVPSIKIVNDKLGKSLKEEKPASDPLQIVPSIKIVNDKPEKSLKEEKPNLTNSTNDFSELFTNEDIGENEASKLANELNDVDTTDILEESRNLLNQLRRNKN